MPCFDPTRAPRRPAQARLAQALLLALLVSVPLWASPFYLEFATLILIFALFAMSLDLLVGYAGLVSLGHAAFFGIGAYATALLIERGIVQVAWVLPLSVLAAGLAAAAIGALAVRTAGVSFIMITLALAQLVYSVALNAPWAGSTDGMLVAQRPLAGISGVDLERPAQFYGYCLLLTGACYGVMRRLVGSPFGRALQGIRANPERMEAMGYRIGAYRLTVFIQAGMFAGVAGHCFAASQFFIDPSTLHWTASGQVLMMVVLGGEGTLLGPALGALIFRGLEQWISSYTDHWMLPMGLILVLLVLAGRGGVARLGRRAFVALRAGIPDDVRGNADQVGGEVAGPSASPHPPAPSPYGEGVARSAGGEVAEPARQSFMTEAGIDSERPARPRVPSGEVAMAERAPLLETRGLTKSFGALRVNHAIDLAIAEGETRAVIGPNGAGKTTLVNQIAGHLRPDRGQILFRGRAIEGLPPHRVATLGIGRSFQRTNLFPEFTVFENVRLAVQGLHLGRRLGRQAGRWPGRMPVGLPGLLRCWRPAADYREIDALAERVLETVSLAERRGDPAAALSHGEQRQLELAMVLALEPELLLLDEPMAGLSLEESRRLTALLGALKSTHTILLIEHDMDAVFALADTITVLVYGQAIATGGGEAIRGNAAVREAYLGEG